MSNDDRGRKSVLERVVRKGHAQVGLPHARQEVLDPLLGRRFREGSSPHRREHLCAPVLVGDRDHAVHDACMQLSRHETRHETL